MNLYECWERNDSLEVEIKPATVYENRGEGYRDYPDGNTRWLLIRCGADSLNLHVTASQLKRLYDLLGHALHDERLRLDGGNVEVLDIASEGPDVGLSSDAPTPERVAEMYERILDKLRTPNGSEHGG